MMFIDREAYSDGFCASVNGEPKENNPIEGFAMQGSFFSWRSWNMGWENGRINDDEAIAKEALA